MNTAHRSLIVIAGLAGIALAASMQPATQPPAVTPALTPATPAQSGNLRSVLDTFRSDLNASKVRTLNEAMKLTATEAATFWPIYQKYEAELGAVDDRRIALIRDFVTLDGSGQFTEESASDIAGRWLAVVQDRLDLWKKYHREISDAVSPIRAAQFLQVEHQISLLVDINIASEMPKVGR